MKTVKEIHEFFMKRKDGKELSLGDFMDTVPGFIVEKDETGGEKCNWTMAQEYYRICGKMCDDLLLINVQPNRTMCLGNEIFLHFPCGINFLLLYLHSEECEVWRRLSN